MHTPGPWKAHGNMKATTPLVQSVDRLVARMPGTTEEDEANARLIAAAPSLLSALEGLVDCGIYATKQEAAFRDALAAIAEVKQG